MKREKQQCINSCFFLIIETIENKVRKRLIKTRKRCRTKRKGK